MVGVSTKHRKRASEMRGRVPRLCFRLVSAGERHQQAERRRARRPARERAAAGASLRRLEDEREGDVDRAARGSREAPTRDERLHAARDLGVAERVLLDVHSRNRTCLRDRPVDDDLTAQRRVPLEGALVARLDGAESRTNFLRDHGRIELAVDGGRLALDRPRDLLLGRGLPRAAARDRAAAAQAAHGRDASRAAAAALDAAQLIVTGRDADAADALEGLLLITIDVALAEHVGDRAALARVGAEELEETGRLDLLGETRATLGVRTRLVLGALGRLFRSELLLLDLLLGDLDLLLLFLLLFLLLLDLLDLLLLGLLLLGLLHHLDEAVGHGLDVGLARPIDAAEIDDEAEVNEERDRGDDREEPVEVRRHRAAHRGGQLRTRLRDGRRDELEEDRHVGERDLAARPVVEGQLEARALLLDLSGLLELSQRNDLVADGDAGVHALGEVRDVLVAAHLEEQPVARQRFGRDDEHVLRRLPDRDVLALADEALLDDATALNDADAEDLRLRDRPGYLLFGCCSRHA